jgi:hypothetical protein
MQAAAEQDVCAALLGDPVGGRSALDAKLREQARNVAVAEATAMTPTERPYTTKPERPSAKKILANHGMRHPPTQDYAPKRRAFMGGIDRFGHFAGLTAILPPTFDAG